MSSRTRLPERFTIEFRYRRSAASPSLRSAPTRASIPRSRSELCDVNLVVLFLDAIYLPVRPSGPKEGVICAWGITETGARALVSVRLGMCEAKEDWLELGRDLTTRGLAAPRLVVADGAPGLISAIEEIWPRADRQHRPPADACNYRV